MRQRPRARRRATAARTRWEREESRQEARGTLIRAQVDPGRFAVGADLMIREMAQSGCHRSRASSRGRRLCLSRFLGLSALSPGSLFTYRALSEFYLYNIFKDQHSLI
jgi:hypothetical protein